MSILKTMSGQIKNKEVMYTYSFNKLIGILVFLVLHLHSSYGQDSLGYLKLLSANIGYGINVPGGNLADRFGQSLSFNTGLEYKWTKRLSLGIDYTFCFGSSVKEDVFAPYRNQLGYVIGVNGYAADLFLRQRLQYLGIGVAYTFAQMPKLSGLRFGMGVGVMAHYIRFVDDSRSLVIADDPYKKGFDRLTRGPALKQELVYQYHSRDKALHFNLGFHMMEGFTKQVRSINFDTRQLITSSRLDILYSLRLTWMMPLLKSFAGEINYF